MNFRASAIAATALLAFATPAAAGVILPQMDPVLMDQTFMSTGFAQTATIQFRNHYAFDVDVYWLNYSGNRVFYTTLAGNSFYDQPTYITHPWIIAKFGSGDTLMQGTGSLLTGFLPQTPGAFGGPDIANIGGVPEPAAWALLLAGFGLVGGAMRRRPKIAVSFA